MRTTAKIVGIGLRKSGTSKKTNKPYDFIPVSIVFSDKNTEGLCAATSNIDPDMFTDCKVELNQEREIFYHGFGGNITIDGIL